ncbi:MAG: tetratricopeptide repeat protein [Sandaracinaceae bacterium]|nr:tetratricopeptide repeat protein [Sandaracinaceae bacterium]
MSRWLVALAVSVAVLVPASVEAQNPLIRQGQEQYDELRFEEALQTLSAALVRSGNTAQQYATIYRLLAFTYLALGREEEASGAYQSMLPLDPDHTLGDEVAPRTRQFFDNVRTEWDAAGRPGTASPETPGASVEIRHRSPPEAERETEVPLTANVEDPGSRVSQLVLAYRQGTSAVFTRLDTVLEGDGAYHATIPASDVAPPLVEYYFEALDAQGLPIAARGDVAAPLRIAVPEPGGNVLEEWWFWTIIGVVVAGGIVAAILIADSVSNSGPATGTFVISVE